MDLKLEAEEEIISQKQKIVSPITRSWPDTDDQIRLFFFSSAVF